MTLISAGRRCQNILEDSSNGCRFCGKVLRWNSVYQLYQLNVPPSPVEGFYPDLFACAAREGSAEHEMNINEWRCPNPATWEVEVKEANFDKMVITVNPKGYLCDVCAEDEQENIQEDGTDGLHYTYRPLDASGTVVMVGEHPVVSYGPS